jgi:hypothetical protein
MTSPVTGFARVSPLWIIVASCGSMGCDQLVSIVPLEPFRHIGRGDDFASPRG